MLPLNVPYTYIMFDIVYSRVIPLNINSMLITMVPNIEKLNTTMIAKNVSLLISDDLNI